MTYRLKSEQFTPDHEWWDCTYDDARTIAALMGWTIDDIYFSGFWSQGDGACFTGSMGYRKGCAAAVRAYAPLDATLHDIAARWQSLQRTQFYSISASVTHTGRYSHERSVSFEWEDARHNYGYTSDSFDPDEWEECARDFMRWIYDSLEREHDYQYAWNMAQRWDECATEASDAWNDAKQAVRDYNAGKRAGLSESPLATLRGAIKRALSERRKAHEEREAIADEFRYWPGDGAPAQSIAEFAAANI